MTVHEEAKQQIPRWWKPTTMLAGLVLAALLAWGVLFVWWQVRPVWLPDIKQPIPVLNENHEISPGEPIVLELVVDKPVETDVSNSTRWIACESGNLITLTSNPTDLPAGKYTIIADSVILPDKFATADTCRFFYRVDFRINPIRDESREYVSEWFTVVLDDREVAR